MTTKLPEGLTYCERCEEPRGESGGKTATCLCDGMICRNCGYGLLRAPGIFYDPEAEKKWRCLPSIAMSAPRVCWGCKQRGEERRRFEIEILRTVEGAPDLTAEAIAAERTDAATKQVRAALLQLERERLVEEGSGGKWSPAASSSERRTEGDFGLTVPRVRERQRKWGGKGRRNPGFIAHPA